MNTPTKIAIYLILSVGALVFGKYFLRDYQHANADRAVLEELDDPMDIAVPNYSDPQEPNIPADPDLNTEPPTEPIPTEATTENGTTGPAAAAPGEEAANSEAPTNMKEADGNLPPPRLGFYGGGFCLLMLGIGLMAAFDISSYLGRGAINTLFNDDGVGTMDDEYEIAEGEWQKGDYLEAIRLMREYLANNPRQVHAALRIAEIYEKDLNNPLAAALEYEEILEKKLPRERWGWAAIHLANLYSGPLEKPDQALALLRRLDEEYGDTQAAEKARRRLAMVDGTAPPSDPA